MMGKRPVKITESKQHGRITDRLVAAMPYLVCIGYAHVMVSEWELRELARKVAEMFPEQPATAAAPQIGGEEQD